jgi:elongation factor G
VPLAEMFGYSSTIRSLTTGRGSFLMQPAGYAPLGPSLSEPVVKARREFREKQKK